MCVLVSVSLCVCVCFVCLCGWGGGSAGRELATLCNFMEVFESSVPGPEVEKLRSLGARLVPAKPGRMRQVSTIPSQSKGC